jgi:hypothetical protein
MGVTRSGLARGIYRVTVDDVSAAGYVFDDSGVLTRTIRR